MKDMIYREDAIKTMRDTLVAAEIPYAVNALFKIPSANTFEITKKTLIETIDNAETVGDIVENIINRPRGTYTNSEGDVEWYATEATCNLCGEPWMGARNFCPNCGAKMKGANNETDY